MALNAVNRDCPPWGGFQQYPSGLDIQNLWLFDTAHYDDRLKSATKSLFIQDPDFGLNIRLVQSTGGHDSTDRILRTTQFAEKELKV